MDPLPQIISKLFARFKKEVPSEDFLDDNVLRIYKTLYWSKGVVTNQDLQHRLSIDIESIDDYIQSLKQYGMVTTDFAHPDDEKRGIYIINPTVSGYKIFKETVETQQRLKYSFS